MVKTKNTRRCILCLKNMFLLLLFRRKILFILGLSGLSPGSALFMVASSTMGVPLAAVNGNVVPSFTAICWFIIVQAARLVHKCNNKPCIDIMISRTQNNHPKGHLWWETKMIVWLVATWHNRRSRRDQGWAWLLRWIRTELHAHGVSGLIYG